MECEIGTHELRPGHLPAHAIPSAIFGAADPDGGYRGAVGRMRAALAAAPQWRAA